MNKKHSVLWMCCVIGVAAIVFLTRASESAPKPVPPVLSLREFELRSGVKTETFEAFVRQEMAAVAKDTAGMKIRILKGDRGTCKGRYVLLWEFDSVASRNSYFPKEGGFASPAFRDAWKRMSGVMDRFSGYVKEASAYTDYVVVSE